MGSKKTLKILNNGSTVVILLIDSLPILVAFDTKMLPRRGGGGAREGSGMPLGCGAQKSIKRSLKMKPGETRFGALWGPLGVRWTIFGGQDGFMGTLFSHVFFDAIFDSYFHRFLMDLRAGKGQYFIAFLNFLPLELF